MVVVKIQLWPMGDESKSKTIGVCKIANDGTGTKDHGNYNVALSHSGKFFGRPGVWKSGRLLNHKRTLSPFHLVLKALAVALKTYATPEGK